MYQNIVKWKWTIVNESAFVDRRSTMLMHTRLYRMESEVSANNVVVWNKRSKLVFIDRRFKSMIDVSVISKKMFFPATRPIACSSYDMHVQTVQWNSLREVFRKCIHDIHTKFPCSSTRGKHAVYVANIFDPLIHPSMRLYVLFAKILCWNLRLLKLRKMRIIL